MTDVDIGISAVVAIGERTKFTFRHDAIYDKEEQIDQARWAFARGCRLLRVRGVYPWIHLIYSSNSNRSWYYQASLPVYRTKSISTKIWLLRQLQIFTTTKTLKRNTKMRSGLGQVSITGKGRDLYIVCDKRKAPCGCEYYHRSKNGGQSWPSDSA